MLLYYGLLLAFIILMISVMIFLGISSKNSESRDAFNRQVRTIILITVAMIFVLGGLTFFFIESNPDYFRPYVLTMTHINLFFSILAVSIAMLQQV